MKNWSENAQTGVVFRTRTVLRLPLGLKIIYSLCFVRRIYLFERFCRRGLPLSIFYRSLLTSNDCLVEVCQCMLEIEACENSSTRSLEMLGWLKYVSFLCLLQ